MTPADRFDRLAGYFNRDKPCQSARLFLFGKQRISGERNAQMASHRSRRRVRLRAAIRVSRLGAELRSAAIFPWGTLAVNVTACLAIGFLAGIFAGPMLIREEYRLGLTVGVLGGYSTFSTFGLETFNLANDKEFALAGLNMLLSCGLGLLAVWAGYRVAEHWFGV